MTVRHLHRLIAAGARIGLAASLLISGPAMAESLDGKKPRRFRRAKKFEVEKPHKPTELDRLLLPAPDFLDAKAPVGGMVVSSVHWDPFRPEAEKFYTITAGSKDGLQMGDHLLIWRGAQKLTVAQVVVVSMAEKSSRVRVLRMPDPERNVPLRLQAVMEGDRVSLLMRGDAGIWPVKKKKRRRRKRIIKKVKPKPMAQAAATSALPPGKDSIVINGRELPKSAPAGVNLNPAQLPAPEPETPKK